MKIILIGDCAPDRIYRMSDPYAPYENEFELAVAKILSCIYSTYHCVMFSGGFLYGDRLYRPDLALVSKDLSHWFVLEVELVSHSLERHVLPQALAFRYGDPQQDCVTLLARE